MTVKVDLRPIIEAEGFLRDAPDRTRRAMALAMNTVLGGKGLNRYRKGVTEEINLPQSYVDERITFARPATPTSLVATIDARQRPVSLARFASGGSIGVAGVSVQVKKAGGSKNLKGAFLVRLNAGANNTDNFNLGLAVRLKPGQTIVNKRDTSHMVHLAPNVVLLYGPSLDQVLNNEVIDKENPEVISTIETEFYRQFDRLA